MFSSIIYYINSSIYHTKANLCLATSIAISGGLMDKKQQKKILIMALYAGELMMKSGAEIYRVEDTIVRICKSCQIPYVECFATGTGIFLSLDKGGEDDDMYTFLKRIETSSIDLGKISEINNFSRAFSTKGMTVDEGLKLLKTIDSKKPYSLPVRFLGTSLVGPSFCLMLGGGLFEVLSCFFAILGAYTTSLLVGKMHFNNFVRIFLSCALATIISLLLNSLQFSNLLGPVIIGAITLFLPGVAITNSARDLLSGQMLAGMAKATEAIISAVAIAVGVGLVLQIWQITGGSL